MRHGSLGQGRKDKYVLTQLIIEEETLKLTFFIHKYIHILLCFSKCCPIISFKEEKKSG